MQGQGPRKPKLKLTDKAGAASESTPSPAKLKVKGKAKSPSEAAVLVATTMKKDYLNFQARLKTVLTATATDADWKWAANSLTEVKAINEELDRKMTPWGRSLMCVELRDFRKEHDDVAWVKQVSDFETGLKETLDRGTKEIKMLIKMHRSRK